jgi:Mrp family chromosome partitioning ATPase
VDRISVALQRARGSQEASIGPAPTPLRAAIAYTSTRVVQVAPQLLRANRVAVGASDPFANGFRLLRTQLLHRLRESGGRIIAITAPRAGAGSTVTAINLALSLAMEVGLTALLVDAKLRAPAIHRAFGLDEAPGLAEHLADGLPLERVLVNPSIDRFVVLPAGAPRVDSAELLGSPAMQALSVELKGRYHDRMIVFDLPPLLDAPDALAFAPHADATLLVVADGASRRDDIGRATELLAPFRLHGLVLNKSREARRSNGARSGWLRALLGREES